MNPPYFVFSYFRAFVINFNQAVAHDDALEEITKVGTRDKLQARVTLKAPREAYGSLQTDRRFVLGVPELLVEVAHTSRYTDLGPKL